MVHSFLARKILKCKLLAPAKRGIEQVLLCTPLEPIKRIHRYALCAEFIATTFFIRQVRNMPPHGALYRSAIARMFRQCGKGKALFFEDTRFGKFNLSLI